jgi:heme/copper-type cytochrome/quinol oxidase subunit 1
MKLSAPKVTTWWIAVILGALGILASFVTIPFLTGIAFWLVVVGLALLALATSIAGL